MIGLNKVKNQYSLTKYIVEWGNGGVPVAQMFNELNDARVVFDKCERKDPFTYVQLLAITYRNYQPLSNVTALLKHMLVQYNNSEYIERAILADKAIGSNPTECVKSKSVHAESKPNTALYSVSRYIVRWSHEGRNIVQIFDTFTNATIAFNEYKRKDQFGKVDLILTTYSNPEPLNPMNDIVDINNYILTNYNCSTSIINRILFSKTIGDIPIKDMESSESNSIYDEFEHNRELHSLNSKQLSTTKKELDSIDASAIKIRTRAKSIILNTISTHPSRVINIVENVLIDSNFTLLSFVVDRLSLVITSNGSINYAFRFNLDTLQFVTDSGRNVTNVDLKLKVTANLNAYVDSVLRSHK